MSADGNHNLKRSFPPKNIEFNFPINTVPTFHSLRSFCRIPHHLYLTADGVTAFEREADHVSGAEQRRVSEGFSPPPYSTFVGRNTRLGVRPVLDRAMFLISAALEEDDSLAWSITPIITLWNPYNTALEIEGAVSHIWLDIPFFLRWQVFEGRGNMVFSREMHTSGCLVSPAESNAGGRSVSPYFYAAITPDGQEIASSAGSTETIRFEPGEVRVFAPAQQTLRLFRPEGSIRDRTLFLRPVRSPDDFTTEGGFLVPTGNRPLGWGFRHRMLPSQFAQLRFYAGQGEDYPFFICLEDATRARGNDRTARDRGRVVADVVANAFARSGEVTTFESPRLRYSQLRREPVPIGVLEAYHRVAHESEDVENADLTYTGNPRQPWMNPFITNTSFETGPQYRTRMRAVSSFNGVLQSANGGRSAFYGASQSAGSGRTHLSFFELPRAPLLSLAAFQHADLSSISYAPANQFANSWASAYVARNRVAERTRPPPRLGQVGSDEIIEIDHCYLQNEALWDGWFFSGAAPTIAPSTGAGGSQRWESPGAQTERSLAEVVRSFVADPLANPLRNSRMRLFRGGVRDEALVDRLLAPSGCTRIAGHLLIDGAFNVNSTDIEAWKAILTGLRGSEFEVEGERVSNSGQTPFPRFRDPVGTANDDWHGYRTLSDEKIEAFATELVEQIRRRGPFLSLGEFVNRRVAEGELGLKGALQAAIDEGGLNEEAFQGTFSLSPYEASSRANVKPNDTGVGIPGFLTQADVLTSLGPILTVRSDTFTIRGYGEAHDSEGNVLARAWAEATVQRVPEFVDRNDSADTAMDELSPINSRFGRRFRIVSFQYLPGPPEGI